MRLMTTGFSATAWARNSAAYETIRTMPFNAELAEGTLPRDTFEHYMVQDAHYLVGFGRALALAAAKAPHPDRIVQFSDAAREAIVVERALHGSFFKEWGITAGAFADTPVSPACHHYVSYLIATAFALLILACASPADAAEGRTIWVTRYDYKSKDDVRRIVANCAS